MLKHFYIFISLAVLSPSTNAAWTTEYCQVPGYLGLRIENFPKGSQALKCGDVEQTFIDMLKPVQQISPVELAGPITIVYNVKLDRAGVYEWSLSTIDVGIPDITQKQVTTAMFQHEMGHRIYSKILSQVLVDFSEIEVVVQSYANYAVECLVSEKPPASCATNPAPMDIKLAAANAPARVHDFIEHNQAYEEVFGDVVAALAANDRDINLKTITEFAGAELAVGRGFSENVADSTKGENLYRRFGPIRKDIWDRWITPRLNDKPALLRDLAYIMIVESAMNFAADKKLSSEARAQVQIERLRQQLKL